MLRLKGFVPSSQWLDREITPPTHEELIRLELSQNTASYERNTPYNSYTVAATSACVGNDTFTTFTWERTDRAEELRSAAGL